MRRPFIARLIVPAGLVLALAGGGCSGAPASDGWSGVNAPATGAAIDSTTPEVGKPAPNFILTTHDGQTLELASLRGQPVVLNFWATWCGPCRAEMPELQALYDDLHPKGLHVVAVDIQEPVEAVIEFRRSMGVNFPTPIDADGEVTRRYLIRGVPTTLILDEQGIIRDIHSGPVTRRLLDEKLGKLGMS